MNISYRNICVIVLKIIFWLLRHKNSIHPKSSVEKVILPILRKERLVISFMVTQIERRSNVGDNFLG